MENLFTGRTLLVPIDFTPVTENALHYANGIAKAYGNHIKILHVVDKENQSAEAGEKLRAMASANSDSSGIKTEAVLRLGNIFDDIGDAASACNAALIIMGTHGIKGMQKITGSKAMKVITHSKVPFIVVQKKKFEPVKNILIPVDFSMEMKQVLIYVKSVAAQFNASILLLPKPVSDEHLSKKVKLNIGYSKGFFEQEHIPVKVLQDYDGKDFLKETIRAAVNENANLVAIIIDPETGLTDYIMGPYEQKVIANEAEIPVMCVNMKTVRFFSYDIPVK